MIHFSGSVYALCGGRLLRSAFAVYLVQQYLAQAHGVGRNLDVFVRLDVFQCLFERKDLRRGDRGLVIRPRSAHVGELLGLGDVDRDVVLARVLADHLPLVDLIHRADEEASAILQFVDRIGEGRAGLA